MNPKLFHAGGLKPRDIPLGMSLGFRRKAQVRTILPIHFAMAVYF